MTVEMILLEDIIIFTILIIFGICFFGIFISGFIPMLTSTRFSGSYFSILPFIFIGIGMQDGSCYGFKLISLKRDSIKQMILSSIKSNQQHTENGITIEQNEMQTQQPTEIEIHNFVTSLKNINNSRNVIDIIIPCAFK